MKAYLVKNKVTGQWATSISTSSRIRRGLSTPPKVVAYHLFITQKAANEHKRHLNRWKRGDWYVQGVTL